MVSASIVGFVPLLAQFMARRYSVAAAVTSIKVLKGLVAQGPLSNALGLDESAVVVLAGICALVVLRLTRASLCHILMMAV
jgi:hypothetical protein